MCIMYIIVKPYNTHYILLLVVLNGHIQLHSSEQRLVLRNKNIKETLLSWPDNTVLHVFPMKFPSLY